jgi:peptidoglycan-N-acetylglucosamine deacetylase
VSEVRVALTFDAEHPDRSQCPPGTQEAIVDALEDAGLRATFFLQGRWVTAYPATARRIAERGHLIGSHSDYHARMPLLSDDGVRADVAGAARAIEDVAGVDPRPWFRCPFGEGHDDARVLSLLEGLGYRNVHWDVDGEDWGDDRTASDVEQAIVDATLRASDGVVVLLHTWPAPTLAALPAIVRRLREAGASFVTVDEVMNGT